jgi:hypothetical protein
VKALTFEERKCENGERVKHKKKKLLKTQKREIKEENGMRIYKLQKERERVFFFCYFN